MKPLLIVVYVMAALLALFYLVPAGILVVLYLTAQPLSVSYWIIFAAWVVAVAFTYFVFVFFGKKLFSK